jgi:hypothetical protein
MTDFMAQKTSPKKAAKKAPAKKASGRGAGAKHPDAGRSKSPAAKGRGVESKETIKTVRKAAPAPAPKAAAAPEPAVKKEKVHPLSKQDLQYFRNLLLEKRREIIGDVGSMESEAFKGGSNLSNMPIHMADVGTPGATASAGARASRSRGCARQRAPGPRTRSSIRACWNRARSRAMTATRPTMTRAMTTKTDPGHGPGRE